MSTAISQSRFNFDATTATAAKRHGIERAESKANPAWFAEMLRVATNVARSRPTLTMDDVVESYSTDPARPTTSTLRAMSGIVRQLQRDGIIQATSEFVNSRRATNHQCPIRKYNSLVYRKAA